MKAAIYIRVSSAGQADDGTSLDTQRAACEAYAREHELEAPAVFTDVHTGSELWERPQLTALRDAIAARSYQHVIVYALDRLARNVAHQIIVAEECARYGVTLHSVTEDMDDSPEGKLLSYIRGYVAEVEREKIRERTQRGKREKIRQGELPRAAVELYGYRRVDGKRIAYESEAVIVREIFNLALSGKGPAAIAALFNRRGMPSPGKARWWEGQVRSMLRHPAYKGDSHAWRWKTGKSTGGKRTTRIRAEDEWLALPAGVTEAIVAPEVWDAVQKRLAQNAGAYKRNERRPVLLRAMVECAVCGGRAYADRDSGKPVYRCASRHHGGACGASRIPSDELEAWVWDQVMDAITTPEILMAELQRTTPAHDDTALREELAAHQARLRKVDRGADALLARYRESEDSLAWAPFQRQLTEADRERSRINEEIARLQEAIAREAAHQDDLAAVPGICAALADAARNADFDARRQLLVALDAQVIAAGLDWQLSCSLPPGVPDVLTRGPVGYTHGFRRQHEGPRSIKPWGLVRAGGRHERSPT